MIEYDPIVIHAHLYSHGGYGQLAESLGRALETRGVPVLYMPITQTEAFLPLPTWLTDRIARVPVRHFWGLLIASPGEAPVSLPVRHCHLTMWETTKFKSVRGCTNLNRARAAIVPSAWGAEQFRACGVRSPIAVAPLGCDPDRFVPGPAREDGRFVVGCAARMAHGGGRKGVREAAEAWWLAFGSDPDGRLRFKLWSDCPVQDSELTRGDPRVQVERRPLTEAEMIAWYQSNDVYLEMSKGEGFGLNPLRSMACGVPVVGPRHTGLAEYLDHDNAWLVAWEPQPALGYYRRCGEWFVPDVACAASRLIEAKADRHGRRIKAAAARETAERFTWDRTASVVTAAMGAVGWPGMIQTGCA